MTQQIKIINGKRGYHLKVNGLYINHSFEGVKAIKNEIGIPYGATEWISVKAIRDFWNRRRPFIVYATTKPCRSVWGQLVFIPEDTLSN